MDLLNLDDSQFVPTQRESFIDPDLFNPDPAKGQQGVYKAVGRFVPWWKAPNSSILKKNTVMLTHPLSGDRLVVDCPSTIKGRPSMFWALDKMLKDRENNKVDLDIVVEIRKGFSRYLNMYSPFYIFKDPQVPALENKIKIYNFGITIDKMIQKELNPADAELNPLAVKVNPYSLVAGKDFLLVIRKKTKRYKDYTDCKFIDAIVPFRFMIGDQKHTVTVEELQQVNVETPTVKFLKENTPNLEKYAYVEWTEETYKQVVSFIKAIIPYPNFMRELIENTREEKMKQMLIDATSTNYGNTAYVSQQAPTTPAVAQGLMEVSMPATPAAPATTAPVAAAPVIPETPAPIPEAIAPAAPVVPAPMPEAPAVAAPVAPVAPAAAVTIPEAVNQTVPAGAKTPLDENKEFENMLRGL